MQQEFCKVFVFELIKSDCGDWPLKELTAILRCIFLIKRNLVLPSMKNKISNFPVDAALFIAKITLNLSWGSLQRFFCVFVGKHYYAVCILVAMAIVIVMAVEAVNTKNNFQKSIEFFEKVSLRNLGSLEGNLICRRTYFSNQLFPIFTVYAES